MKRLQDLLACGAILFLGLLVGCGGTPVSSDTETPASSPVTVAIAATPGHLGAAESYQFSAIVQNSIIPSVFWALSECSTNCGSISSEGLYTAPATIPAASLVTVTATAQADRNAVAKTIIVLRPLSLSLTPNMPANVLPAGTRTFATVMDHDPQNAGVTWALSGDGCSGEACGTLTNVTTTSAVYQAPATAPNPPTVSIVATSVTDPAKSAWATLTVSASPMQLTGKYAFLINGYHYGELEAIAGHFEADGNGNLTGIWDVNRGDTLEVGTAITGTYNIQPDGHGSLTLKSASMDLSFVLSVDDSGVSARFAESTIAVGEILTGSSGIMIRQDDKYFTMSSIVGDRVLALYGEHTNSHTAALGRFTADAGGGLTAGVVDTAWTINQNTAGFGGEMALTGTFGAPDSETGRGTASLQVSSGSASATYHFAYFLVSSEKMLLVQTDARNWYGGNAVPVLSGEVQEQKYAGEYRSASLNAPLAFHLRNAAGNDFTEIEPMIRVGVMVPNGQNSLTLFFDQNLGGTATSETGVMATYSIAANGRATWNAPENAIAYLVDENRGFFMSQDADGAGFGSFERREIGPYNIASFAGSILLNTLPPTLTSVENVAGWMTADAFGGTTATLYINEGFGATSFQYTGTALVESNGRGTLSLTGAASVPRELVFWQISMTRAVGILVAPHGNPGDGLPALVELQQRP